MSTQSTQMPSETSPLLNLACPAKHNQQYYVACPEAPVNIIKSQSKMLPNAYSDSFTDVPRYLPFQGRHKKRKIFSDVDQLQ